MNIPLFEVDLKVRDYECDAQGIVNNANYQHYYEIGRHEFLEHHGLDFYDLHTKGIDLVLVSIYIRYMKSLKGGQKFLCTIDSLEKKGIRYLFNQKIIRKSDNKICSEAKAEVVSIVNGRVSKLPILDEAFAKYFQK